MPKLGDGSYDVDFENVYFGPESVATGDRHPITRVNIFLPDATVYGDGPFPVVCTGINSGFETSLMRDNITSSQGIVHALLEEGVAIAWLTYPVVRGTTTANDEFDTNFDVSVGGANQYGDSYRGNGILIAPEDFPATGSAPAAYEAAYPARSHPFLDDEWLMPEKAIGWCVQHLRHNKALYNLNGLVGAHGVSGAGVAALYAACSRDKQVIGGSGQETVSSRLDVFTAGQVPAFYLALVRDGSGDFQGYHFPHASSTPDFDLPAPNIQSCYDFLPELVIQAGFAYYAMKDDALIGANRSVPGHLHYVDATGAPATFNGVYDALGVGLPEAAETVVHASWAGYQLKKMYPHWELTVATVAVDPTLTDADSNKEDFIIDDANALIERQLKTFLTAFFGAESVISQTYAFLDTTVKGAEANSYITVARADEILAQRLYTEAWSGAAETPNADDYTVAISTAEGSVSVYVDAGVGTFVAGTRIRFAGHSTFYTVKSTLSGSGSLSITPALTTDVPAYEGIIRVTASEKEAALTWATTLLDQMMVWEGTKRTVEQRLRWPRSGVINADGHNIDYDTIPEILEIATAEFALSLLESNKFKLPAALGQGVSEVVLGPFRAKIDSNATEPVIPPGVLSLLSYLGSLESAAQGNTRIVPLGRA